MPEASTTARGGDPAGGRPACADVHGERLVLAAGVDDAVAALPGDAGHGGAVPDPVTEGVGEWLQVQLDPLGAGRVATRVGLDPARWVEQAACGRVDELGPAGEQPDVAPRRDGGAGPLPALEDDAARARARAGARRRPGRSGRRR